MCMPTFTCKHNLTGGQVRVCSPASSNVLSMTSCLTSAGQPAHLLAAAEASLSRSSSRQRKSSTAPTLRTPMAAAAAASSAAASANTAAPSWWPRAESSHCRLHGINPTSDQWWFGSTLNLTNRQSSVEAHGGADVCFALSKLFSRVPSVSELKAHFHTWTSISMK